MIDVQKFLQPISVDQPCGEDLSFSTVFDAIQQARIEDDPLLDQGEWVTERKTANWAYVQQQCTELLSTQSKDLRLCLWLCEALTHRQDFAGLAEGLGIINAVIAQYWFEMYPLIEDDDLDQRISLLQWFVLLIQKLPKTIPLTSSKSLNYNDFESAQILKTQLDNNPDLYDDGLPAHKVTAEQYHEAANQTPVSFLQNTFGQFEQAVAAWQRFKDQLDNLLGIDAPAFASTDQVLERIQAHLNKTLKERGVLSTAESAMTTGDVLEHSSSQSTIQPVIQQSGFAPQMQNHIQNRQQAMIVLEQISDYFSSHEPHSPVSYMLKKTIKWANMPLHEWLASVVKQDEPLASLNEMLGIQADSGQDY